MLHVGPDSDRVAAAVSELSSPDRRARAGAADDLVRAGEPAVDRLIGLVRGADEGLRFQAVRILEQMGHHARSAIPALLAGLRDPEWPIPGATADALAAIGPAALAPLREAAADEDEAVRYWGARALGRMRGCDPERIAALADLLDDSSPAVRAQAAAGLAAIGTPAARAAAERRTTAAVPLAEAPVETDLVAEGGESPGLAASTIPIVAVATPEAVGVPAADAAVAGDWLRGARAARAGRGVGERAARAQAHAAHATQPHPCAGGRGPPGGGGGAPGGRGGGGGRGGAGGGRRGTGWTWSSAPRWSRRSPSTRRSRTSARGTRARPGWGVLWAPRGWSPGHSVGREGASC